MSEKRFFENIMIFYMWLQNIFVFSVTLILRELWAKNDLKERRFFIQTIVLFREKLILRQLWAKNDFSKKERFFTCDYKISSLSLRKGDFKRVMSKKLFLKKKERFYTWSQNNVIFSATLILRKLWAKNELKKEWFSHLIINIFFITLLTSLVDIHRNSSVHVIS